MKKISHMLMIVVTAVFTVMSFTGMSYAASALGSMTVSATVTASCSVVSTTVLNITGYTGAPKDSTSSIEVNCTDGTPYNIAMNAGSNYTSVLTQTGIDEYGDPVMELLPGCQRQATNGTNYLQYNLYQNDTHTSVWGDGGLCGQAKSGTGDGNPQLHTVYGRVPSQAVPPSGNYSDTLTVTVNY